MDIEKIINEVIEITGIITYIIICEKQESKDYWVVYTFDKDLIVEGLKNANKKDGTIIEKVYNEFVEDEQELIERILYKIEKEGII